MDAPAWSLDTRVTTNVEDEGSGAPTVSIAVLCYNTGGLVVEALDCLRRQTYQDFEVIVVDDGSVDDSVATVQRWVAQSGQTVTLLENGQNRGIPASLNSAVGHAKGILITWISDDLWEEERLETAVRIFESLPPTVGVLFGDANIIDETGTNIGFVSPASTVELLGIPHIVDAVPMVGELAVVPGNVIGPALLYRCFIPAPTAIVRRDLYDKIGGYDEKFAIEDLDFWIRAAKVSDFAYLRVPLVQYRLHRQNFTSGRSSRYLDSLAAILARHSTDEPSSTAVAKRHIREECFRVASALLANGNLYLAIKRLRQHYVPNIQWSMTCLKETLLLAARAGECVGRIAWRRDRRQVVAR